MVDSLRLQTLPPSVRWGGPQQILKHKHGQCEIVLILGCTLTVVERLFAKVQRQHEIPRRSRPVARSSIGQCLCRNRYRGW